MRRLWLTLAFSVAIHGALYGAMTGYFAWEGSRLENAVLIDLAASSLIRRAPQAGAPAYRKPPEPWILGTGNAAPPPPKALPLSPTAAVEEANALPCPPPCPERPGDWVPAASAAVVPDLAPGTFSEDDYPSAARVDGLEGDVVVEGLIDAEGRVRSVNIVKGLRPDIDAKTLERLRSARYRPARDADGNPIACRYQQVITWSLH